MKKSILLALSVFAVAVLAVSFSGCLASGDDKTVIIDNPATIQSVTYYTFPVNGDDVIADILVQIQGTHSQSVDKENITVTIIGDKIYVNVPVTNSSPVNTKDFGYEKVEVVLGTKDQFKDGDYTVIINCGTEKEYTSDLKFEGGELYSYGPGSVGDVAVGTDGNNITVDVNVVLGGSAETVDKENITSSGKFEDGVYEIYIPTQVKDGVTTLNLIYAQESFVIGQLDQLEDGTYTVSVNGVEVTFTISGGQLVTE
ncbi:hypothetical protein [Methanimicrococcus blatticola]|uniref:Uncharacterized protein n=1 Tax=Methanimicrococcus blatticola TaxID=91560 RepID=A0A484F598_9EURY|nr:hypothetical protein [Methanimicrococcus blatticola]MBZ3935705.1 hypothetical protein [Methanimicrococcus blatticola]MCC2508174.1 hypothetical protein [Methanimicrococcus blatticola]TDQ68749.1 hypothetical protein C7391_0942 [Methanimicrococcus blatticola]